MPEAAADGFKRQLKLRCPLGELTLMILVSGDVLDLRYEAYNLPIGIAHCGHVDQDVDNLSERPQVTLLDRVAVPPSLQDLMKQDQVRLDILWMGEVPEMRPEHLLHRQRQKLGESGIAANDASLQIDQGDPYGGVLEGKVEQRQAGFGIVGRIGFRYHLSSKDKSSKPIGVF